jgi:hypothetical protein
LIAIEHRRRAHSGDPEFSKVAPIGEVGGGHRTSGQNQGQAGGDGGVNARSEDAPETSRLELGQHVGQDIEDEEDGGDTMHGRDQVSAEAESPAIQHPARDRHQGDQDERHLVTRTLIADQAARLDHSRSPRRAP